MNIEKLRSLATHHYQTEAEALAAVNQNGYALQYVHNQTPEICLAAVGQRRTLYFNTFATRHLRFAWLP